MTDEMKDGYQILVVNIKYGRKLSNKVKDKPDMTILDVPEGILKTRNKPELFNDSIESFAYNTITKKYGAEVNRCQIFLPID